MLIFWRLLFGHLLADFTFQSNFINRWKRGSLWGMLAHCAMHPLCYLLLTWPFLRQPWIHLGSFSLSGWACIAVVFAVHFAEDQWRVFTIFRYNTPDNTLYFIWDQLIHYAIIFAVIPVGLHDSNAALIPEKWPVLGCLFVLVTHACTVLVYFIEKDLYGRLFPEVQEKYFTMGERLVLAMIFLLPGNLWPLLALGWLSLMRWLRARRVADLSWLSFSIGAAMAIVCGLTARVIYYA
ncbi:MAG: DUF3307 domain-containing protein [Elusimicrobia bacterium]|nr:DUF3307 domain-containing protein [Elusimicrobiota bacterium]MDE2237766.1 DUF3307 domain-containing protein [Elusimicrobiota bacterium]MDE2426506.1 DUF3307 domain-containing protein [Elusimicrobiota bacterium]